MKIRNVVGEDFFRLHDVVNEWSAGDAITKLVPRLFFEHFPFTSFLMENAGQTVGIVIGFISQTDSKLAYIHFIGVNPKFRNQGIARQLYKHFFKMVRELGCEEVTCITTPINKASRAFHEALGFTGEKVENYNGRHEDRIVFKRSLLEVTITTN